MEANLNEDMSRYVLNPFQVLLFSVSAGLNSTDERDGTTESGQTPKITRIMGSESRPLVVKD
jgi:hypothetical protein